MTNDARQWVDDDVYALVHVARGGEVFVGRRRTEVETRELRKILDVIGCALALAYARRASRPSE
jgi:hypothetical protein